MRLTIFLIVTIGAASCSHRNGDIDRVVDPYWDKSFFNSSWRSEPLSEEDWYYRMTVVDTPVNTQAVSIGEGHWLHPEMIRWEITKDYLIGWRSHAAVIGSERDQEEGARPFYRGAPVVAFPITDHFDIVRDYDSTTHEQSNLIVEDRIQNWSSRRFFRVDFSKNLIEQFERSDSGTPIEKGTAHSISGDDPADPNRFRVSEGYFDVTTRQGIKLEQESTYGAYGTAFRYDSAAPVVDIRHSFLKKTANDYEPLHYPDHVMMLDAAGKKILDRNNMPMRMPIWEKFGFYRTNFSGRQTWDKHRGSVESGKIYNITRFNIWQKSKNEDGTPIPMELRTPKPIIYYTNVEHPDSLLNASKKVGEQWDRAFRELVFYAQPGRYEKIEDVPQMWILRENSCNVATVRKTLDAVNGEIRLKVVRTSKVDLSDINRRLEEARNLSTEGSYTKLLNQETAAKQDLERICAALEYYTQSLPEPFVYQRPGDLRFNMMNLITKRALTAWSGLGPMYADPLTGETIQAVANVNLWYIDRRAAQAAKQIEMMNGEIDIDGVLFGEEIRTTSIKSQAHLLSQSKAPSATALQEMSRRFNSLRRESVLSKDLAPGAVESRLHRVAGTSFEKKLFQAKTNEKNDELLMAHLLLNNHGASQDPTEEILDEISPARGKDLASRMIAKKNESTHDQHLIADSVELVDQLIFGIATQYQDLSYRQRFEKIREAIYMAVMLHEIGHNMGLAHNMAASSDALNFGERFWEVQSLPAEMEDAIDLTNSESDRAKLASCIDQFPDMTTQNCLAQEETMYSSIMDYHGNWNADLNGLGPYDKAAIKFGYAQLAEVLPTENLTVDIKNQSLKRWLFLNDWRKIPAEFVSSVDKIHQRQHVKYDWGQTATKFVPPPEEVPYRYCIDSSGSKGVDCKAFDFGPDMRTRAQWLKTQYWQHYLLTHFSQGRIWSLDWDFANLVNRDLQIFDEFNDILKWYFHHKLTDPQFSSSDAEMDYLSAVVDGLNHFSHVLGHPEPGQFSTAPAYKTDDLTQTEPDGDRLTVGRTLVPWSNLTACGAKNAATIQSGKPVSARAGYFLSTVPLGSGRPFYMGLTNDYEDSYITAVGSSYAKMAALYFLVAPSLPYRIDGFDNERFHNVNWYRLFPDEVAGLIHKVVTDDRIGLGPVLDADGNLTHRDLLDPITLKKPDYTGYYEMAASASSVMPYRAALYAAALMSGQFSSDLDMTKTMKVSVKGSDDDLKSLDDLPADEVASFVHPIMGYVYRANKIGDHPIAYDLIKKLDRLKQRYLRLDTCVRDSAVRSRDTFCHCIKEKHQQKCCQPDNPSCPSIGLEPVGEGNCSLSHLVKRRDEAREKMEETVGFLDDMRWLVQRFDSQL